MFCAQLENFTIYLMDVSLVLLGISKNMLPYIANHSRWKSFAVAKLNWKTLTVGQSFVWPKPIVQAISLKKFHSYRSIYENCKTFPPDNVLQYTIYNIPLDNVVLLVMYTYLLM